MHSILIVLIITLFIIGANKLLALFFLPKIEKIIIHVAFVTIKFIAIPTIIIIYNKKGIDLSTNTVLYLFGIISIYIALDVYTTLKFKRD